MSDEEPRERVEGDAVEGEVVPPVGGVVYPEDDPTHGQPVDAEGNPLVPEDETEEQAEARRAREERAAE